MGKTDLSQQVTKQIIQQQQQKHYLVGKSESIVPTICYLKCPVFNKNIMSYIKEKEIVAHAQEKSK